MKKRLLRIRFMSSILGQRKGIVSEYLPWILIAVAVLVILMITIFVLRGRGISLIDQIKNLLG